MMEIVANFIHTKQIDSLQKLRLLFFLHQHPEIKRTRQELAQRLYLGDLPLLEEIITELQSADLVDCVENCYKLRDEAEVRVCLQYLTRAFEDPVTRQEVFYQVKQRATLNSALYRCRKPSHLVDDG